MNSIITLDIKIGMDQLCVLLNTGNSSFLLVLYVDCFVLPHRKKLFKLLYEKWHEKIQSISAQNYFEIKYFSKNKSYVLNWWMGEKVTLLFFV